MMKHVSRMYLRIDGREMFSNSTVALGRRGLAGMGYVNNLIEIRRVG